MYRTFMSAMRIGCIAAMTMFLAAPAVAGSMEDQNETSARSSGSMSGQTTSQQRSQTPSERGAATSGQAMSENDRMTTAHPKYQRLDHLIGRTVRDSEGKKLGNIADLVLDETNSSISYAVLSYGGFLGFGDKLFAVPLSEFHMNPEKGTCTLDIRKAYLEDAPGFPKDQWPNMADENWARRIETFYREGRQGAHASQQNLSTSSRTSTSGQSGARVPIKYRRVTGLISLPAKDFQGETMGQLEGIVADTQSHQVVYGVVILDTTVLALERELAVVPWNAIEVVPEVGALRVHADEEMLDAVAFARGREFPYLGDPSYAQGIERQFEGTPYWETLGFVPGDGPMGESAKRSAPAEAVDVSAWRPGSEYNQRFDPELVTTLRGTIQSIGVFNVAKDSVEGLRLRIKTADGDTKTVHAGPRPFIESQGVTLHFGDEVTVTGAPTRIGWRPEILMASTIRTQGQTLRLRAADGTPQWNADTLRSGRPSSSPSNQ